VAYAAPGRLLSHYKVSRDSDGHLVLLMPWPGGSLLGCAAPAVAISIIGGLLALIGNSPVAAAIPVFALSFAVIFVVMLAYQGSHAWVVKAGEIKRGTTFGDRYWAGSRWSPARSVVLKRVMWPSGRGSSDRVFVVSSRGARSSLLTVLNWDGSESRLATGGRRSLARTGPIVPDAGRPSSTAADETLKSAVSESVREMAELLVNELHVPLLFECEVAPPPPPRRPDRQRWI
jgi:hypothetical protein